METVASIPEFADRCLVIDDKPTWHGLEERLQGPLTATQVGEILTPYDVVESPLFTTWDNAPEVVPTHKAIFAISHDGKHRKLLSVQTEGYSIFAPMPFFRLVDAMSVEGKCSVATAGTYKGLRVLYCSAFSSTFEALDGDTVKTYLCAGTSHDGSGAVRFFFSGTRVICDNTYQLAQSEANGSGFTMRHTSGLTPRLEDIRAGWVSLLKTRQALETTAKTLAAIDIGADRKLQTFFTRLYLRLEGLKELPVAVRGDKAAVFRATEKAQSALVHMNSVFQAEREKLRAGPSLWLAVNAVTNWRQHRPMKGTGVEVDYENKYGKGAADTSDVFGAAMEEYAAL